MGVKKMMKEIIDADLDEDTLQDYGDEAYECNNGIYEIMEEFHQSVMNHNKEE